MSRADLVDYLNMPLELFSVADLTEALGFDRAAQLLGVSRRALYTVRSTNKISFARLSALQAAVRQDEDQCRRRLISVRNIKRVRTERSAQKAAEAV